MTRAEQFDRAMAAREQAEKIEREGAHALYLARQHSARRHRSERLDALNAAFDRLRSEARS